RLRDLPAVAKIEPEYQKREASDRHPGTPARDDIGRQKYAAEEQCRAEILLKKEQDEREADAGGDRQYILDPRQVDPPRPSRTAPDRDADVPEHFPPARKESRQEQREQQTDRLDGLHRTEIDFCAAGARTGPEQNQQHRQRQRADERQI